MQIQENYNLSKLNTFSISANAEFFVEAHTEADLVEIFTLPQFRNIKKVFLGGGSNVLFTKDFDGLVILNKLKGIEILKEDSKNVIVRCMGGEIWHDLVTFAVDRGLWGIENLSLIPGTVGAAPMQNIGAYGAELKDVLENVEAIDINTGKNKIFSKEECKFGYRDSIFKNDLKGKYFITAVTLKLSKVETKNITYKILQEYLERNKIEIKNSKDISDAVSRIRKSKLPDPIIIPNAGSFFKNVFVKPAELEKLKKKYPEILIFWEKMATSFLPRRSFAQTLIKVPAGWFIEQCGWKGKRIGNVGVHDKQALVLVNFGGATGEEVLNLANKIMTAVKEKFGLGLLPEVNLI